MKLAGLVVTCEHATRDLPAGVDLGLAEAVLSSHRGWDPGAAEVARALALALDAPLLLGAVSRLYIDLNRSEAEPDLCPAASFGVAVPGNQDLAPAEREARLERYHRPYRRRVLELVEASRARAGRCLHLSAHSFTPTPEGRPPRSVEVGVLFDPARGWEAEVSEGLVAGLRTAGWDARSNEPYLGIDDGLTTWLRTRFAPEAYAGIELEGSQALLADAARARALARDVTRLLRAALA